MRKTIRIIFEFRYGYLVGRQGPQPKLGHQTDWLWCVNNLPRVVTWQWNGWESKPWPRDHWVRHG